MEKVNLSFNPILTIIAGVIIIFIINSLLEPLPSVLSSFIAPIIGGFIATYFAKKKRIRYGLYTGLGVLLIQIMLINFFLNLNDSLMWLYIQWLFIINICFAIVGGFIGKTVYNRINIKEDLNQ